MNDSLLVPMSLGDEEIIDLYLKELFENPDSAIEYCLKKIDDIFLKDYHIRMKRQHDRKPV